MFYFTEPVVNLKAWQLYLGNSFFTFFVGLILIIITRLLGFIGLHSEVVNTLLHKVGRFTHAASPEYVHQYIPQIGGTSQPSQEYR